VNLSRHSLNREEGSVLVLGIGIAVLLLLLVTVSANVSVAWSRKVTLQAIADGAALSGSQGIDVQSIYGGSSVNSIRLSPKAVNMKVDRYLRQAPVASRVPNLRKISVRTIGDSVKVELECSSELPFSYLIPGSAISIRTAATARRLLN